MFVMSALSFAFLTSLERILPETTLKKVVLDINLCESHQYWVVNPMRSQCRTLPSDLPLK